MGGITLCQFDGVKYHTGDFPEHALRGVSDAGHRRKTPEKGASDINAEKRIKFARDEIEHFLIKARMHTDPERGLHQRVRVRQRVAHAVAPPLEIGLAREVSRKEKPGSDPVLVEVFLHVCAGDRRILPQRYRKAEP